MTVATTSQRKKDWLVIAYLGVIHLVALLAIFPQFFSWSAVGVALFLHWVTGCLGITLGFHRLVAHRSFKAPKWLEYFLVFCGTLSCEGSAIDWIGLHRIHHQFSDELPDPHNSKEGFIWSHIGWMVHDMPAKEQVKKYTADIYDDPVYNFLSTYFIPIQVALGFVLFSIGGWPWVIWGIFVRLVAVFHCTWLVNSATHFFGYVTHESGDGSRNCWWVAALSYGEGWHNNHHAFQYSARHGWKWWEIDATYMVIRCLQVLGLATSIKLPKKLEKVNQTN
ncbi:MAG: fatty acid desaturase [Cyanobacteria bacterium P01_H01_bin.15]